MRIEKLTDDDVGRFRDVRLRALADAPSAFGTTFEDARTWPTAAWSELLRYNAVFIAVARGRDVGVVRGGPEGGSERTARVGSLWVEPDARGQDIGASLLAAVVDWARSKGCRGLVLDVSDDNDSAIALYTLLGFVPSGVVRTLPPPREHLGKHELRLMF